MKNKKVVWVTGEFDPGEETSGLFDGVEFVTPETVSEAKEVIESSTASESGSKIDCVVSEYELEDGTAFDVFEDVRERIPDTPCILFTDRDIEEIRSEYRPVIVDYLRREGDEDDYSKLLSLITEATSSRTHTAYPVPMDEGDRLEAVEKYDIEGEGPSPSLEKLTELATDFFGVKTAFVGIVTESEEKFVACHGRKWNDLNREDTVCTHAILNEKEVTVIEDILDDPRFKENEVLSSLGLRFYAGSPLVTPDGRAIGSFCVLDDEPRSFSEEEKESLRKFSEVAMEELELLRRVGEYEREGGKDG